MTRHYVDKMCGMIIICVLSANKRKSVSPASIFSALPKKLGTYKEGLCGFGMQRIETRFIILNGVIGKKAYVGR
jgi:hypothetical protein